MSARVVWGLAPAGKPHPATKWSLLIVLLVVVALGVPKIASAGQPIVQSPTGPESGGVFTGVYTFGIYLYCVGGPSYNSSYSNNLDGTHTFTFYGAADGSLLVSIDGGGMQVLASCGDPNNPPITNVATYTVTRGTPPPPPTPSPTPNPTPTPTSTPHQTPTPTPRPSGGGGSSGGSSSGSSSSSSSGSSPSQGQSSSGTSSAPQQSQTTQSASQTPATQATATPARTTSHKLAKASPKVSATESGSQPSLSLARATLGFAGLALVIILLATWRSRPIHEWLESRLRRGAVMLEPYLFRLRHSLHTHIAVHGKTDLKRKGLSPHHRTGKLLAHHHTSYAALLFLLMVSFVLAGAASLSSQADSSDSALLSLTVLGPPPTTGATITDPTTGEAFTDSSVTILGTCPSGLFLEIWRNGSFAGDTACDVNDLYSVLVTLTPGENDLVARDVDGLGQYGPDSPTVTVIYNPPPPPPTPSPTPSPVPSQAPTGTPGQSSRSSSSPVKSPAVTVTKPATLLLGSAQHYYQGADAGTSVSWNISVAGGVAPYKLTWEWGDGKSDTTNAGTTGTVTMQHSYSKAGIYQVTVRVSDAAGGQALLQLVVVVNGPVTSASLGQSTGDPGNLIAVWPLLSVTTLVVLSLWLGEHHVTAIFKPQLHLAEKQ